MAFSVSHRSQTCASSHVRNWGEFWGAGMARQINRLTARTVASISKPGRHADGGGLYLAVDKNGAKRWVFLFSQAGKAREMGFGGTLTVTLAEARVKASEARAVLIEGRDPISERDRTKEKPTFGTVADGLIEKLNPEFRNAKHRAQWEMTLRVYAGPLRTLPVDVVTTEDVLRVLRPLWATKPETANRVRGRIERVLNAAKALGHREGENPAAWRGHLENLLPKRQKLMRGHHAAMPYAEVSGFVDKLRRNGAVSALALEFTILTAARSGETLGATWDEIQLEQAIWTVPPNRMKAGREHRVPLSARAVEILSQMSELRVSDEPKSHVFPARLPRSKAAPASRPLSNMAMQMVLRRLNAADVTVHGFRSAFRDWVGEQTLFQREIAEAALAHNVGDATERAYRRGDALEKRRELMQAWARYCDSATTNVVPLQRASVSGK